MPSSLRISGPAELWPTLAWPECSSIPGLPTESTLQMETQYIPSVQSTDEKGEIYARIAPTSFPRGPGGDSVVVHRITSYNKTRSGMP